MGALLAGTLLGTLVSPCLTSSIAPAETIRLPVWIRDKLQTDTRCPPAAAPTETMRLHGWAPEPALTDPCGCPSSSTIRPVPVPPVPSSSQAAGLTRSSHSMPPVPPSASARPAHPCQHPIAYRAPALTPAAEPAPPPLCRLLSPHPPHPEPPQTQPPPPRTQQQPRPAPVPCTPHR